MSWPVKLVEASWIPNVGLRRADGTKTEAGDCYFAPWMVEEGAWHKKTLGKHYWEQHAGKRAPIFIVLPDGSHWCPDAMAWSDGQYHGDGWSVQGELPNVTITPSINCPGRFHGWVTAGVVTDDCEGRKF